jgi:SAM-dependent methyltransferase
MSSALTENRIYFASLAHGLILDCSCGEGLFANILKKRGTVVGIDIDKNYLFKAPYENKVLCSVTNLPFKENTFDFVWACAIIEHVKDDCIPEIIRVGKIIVFLTPNKNSPLELIRRMMGLRGTWEKAGHVRLYSVNELSKYGKIYGDTCGLPKRSFWMKIFPSRFWLFAPQLSHAIFLYINKNEGRKTRQRN